MSVILVEIEKEVQDMQTEHRTGETTSPPGFTPGEDQVTIVEAVDRTKQAIDRVETKEAPERKAITPARLPMHSQAAIAQRLNDVPEKATPGFFYENAHQRLHPKGWRTERHMRRKYLRNTFLRIAATDRRGKRTILNLAFMIISSLVLIAVVSVGIIGFMQATFNRFGEKVTRLEDVLPKDSLRVYDRDGNQIYIALDQGMQVSVTLDKISKHMQHAQIAIEDQNFWKNPGYDITGIVRAALENMSQGDVVSGGSTLTQQLIKNVVINNKDRDIARKLQELVLAPDVTRRYTKEQILTMYLNTTYYGQQAYGVEAAAFMYYNKTAAELTIAESAMLAGIVSSPSARDPYQHPQAALQRMKEVLQQMFVQGYITSDQRAESVRKAQEPDFLNHGSVNNRLAPHFSNYVQTELMERLHVKREDLSRAGLIVQTTLDLALQNKTLKIAQRQISEMRDKHNMQNASVVVLDPNTGEILTLLGNANPDDPGAGDFDVASQGFRQPGSTFKPYTYITAIENGMSPGKTVLDEPVTFQMCCGLPAYTPTNYSGKYGGWMSYRTALQLSLNIPSLKLINEVGVDKTLAMIENLGITDYQGSPNMTMALGSLSMHLLDHTAAFSSFANDGMLMDKHAVVSAKDIYGNVIYEANKQGKRVVSPQATFILSNILSDNAARTPEFGKCSPLLLYSTSEKECYAGNPGEVRPVAAKTGTTNDWKDSLTMGYTPDYTVGVWVGNNDGTAMREVTGLMGAAPIWHEVMIALHEGKPIKNFEQPDGVEKRTQAYPGLTTTDWYITKKTN